MKIPYFYMAVISVLVLCSLSYMFRDRSKKQPLNDNDNLGTDASENMAIKKINYKDSKLPDDDEQNELNEINDDNEEGDDDNLEPTQGVEKDKNSKDCKDNESIRSKTASRVLPQFRCSVKQLQDPNYIVKMLEDTELDFPLRVRPAHDILRPVTPDTVDTVADSEKSLISLCENISTNYDLPYGAVVQEDRRLSDEGVYEYILSCTNGIVDELYIVNSVIDKPKKNGKVVQQISMKNMSEQNKKILRKILYEQHKKHGSVNMTVEVGFLCKNLQLPLKDDDTFCIVGICIEFDEQTTKQNNKQNIKQNIRKKVSYPYAGKIDF